MTGVRIYFEGDPALKPGLGDFLRPIRDLARSRMLSWALMACGTGSRAVKSFEAALLDHPTAFNVLLVDSEGPVVHRPWEHIRRLRKGGWKPPRIDDSHCHLMVQTMEAWFVADIDAMKSYYGQGFNENALPHQAEVENIEKDRLKKAMEEATKHTAKRKYDKTKHAPTLLSRLDVERVRNASRHCERLFKTLAEKIGPPPS